MVPEETRAASDLHGQVSMGFIALLQWAETGPDLLSNLLASNLIVHTQHLWGCAHTPLSFWGQPKTWEILCENGQEGRSVPLKLMVS